MTIIILAIVGVSISLIFGIACYKHDDMSEL